MGCINNCDPKQSKKCFRCSFVAIYTLLAVVYQVPIPISYKLFGGLDIVIRKVHLVVCLCNILSNWIFFILDVISFIVAIPMLFEAMKIVPLIKVLSDDILHLQKEILGQNPYFKLIIVTCFTVRFAAGKSVFFIKSFSKKMWKDIDQSWMKMMNLLSDAEREELHVYIRKLFWKIYVIMIFSIFLTLYIFLKLTGLNHQIAILFPENAMLVILGVITLFFFVSITWICSILYLYCVSRVISRLFDKINASIESMMNNEITMDALYLIHDKHQMLSELVLNVDRIFNIYIFVVYFTSIPECCIALYCYLFPSEDTSPDLLLLCITFALLAFLSVALSAAEVANSAHSTYDYLCDLFINETTSEQQSKILLLLERLSGPKIGLSCLELFVVTRSSIVNVIGMTATYFLTIIQFRGVSQSVTGHR
ncbi:uncharacterized protein LOC111620068 [Centruroides sculpturatus]|uniref:uncharacterized protein LOC111620068 n=1 Tax=Centruroides sculpturatus TaxID=218467 RepID=UPI000C6CFC6C|nr:uncharacterized protein LOC111620068 [Centruroides sculpturatus]